MGWPQETLKQPGTVGSSIDVSYISRWVGIKQSLSAQQFLCVLCSLGAGSLLEGDSVKTGCTAISKLPPWSSLLASDLHTHP